MRRVVLLMVLCQARNLLFARMKVSYLAALWQIVLQPFVFLSPPLAWLSCAPTPVPSLALSAFDEHIL